MNYERAVAEAQRGLKLVRPHWHWIYLTRSDKTGKLAVFDDDGHERGTFKPTRSDRSATDWVLVK